MKNLNLSLLIQGLYVFLSGLQLVFIPNILFNVLGISPTTEVWVKVLGIVLLALSTIYFGLYRMHTVIAKKYTVYARWIAAMGLVLLVITGQGPRALLLFAGFDMATAIWSWMELKKQN